MSLVTGITATTGIRHEGSGDPLRPLPIGSGGRDRIVACGCPLETKMEHRLEVRGVVDHLDGPPAAGAPAPVLCVTVCYNSAHHLPGHLSSLLGQCPPPERVLVVDNASSDDSLALVQARFPGVEVCANRRNVGYGAAANQGIAEAIARATPYVLVLNPDVILYPGALAALIQALVTHPSAAVAGPALVIGDDAIAASVANPPDRTRPRGSLAARCFSERLPCAASEASTRASSSTRRRRTLSADFRQLAGRC